MKQTDALAIADKDAGRDIISGIGRKAGLAELANRLDETLPYLVPIIAGLTDWMKISLTSAAALFKSLPLQ